MEKKRLTLYPGSFLWVKGGQGYLYNSQKAKGFQFLLNEEIGPVCKKLLMPENLYSSLYPNENTEDKDFNKWINLVTHVYEAGFTTTETDQQPISYKPMPKLLSDIDYYIWEDQQGFGGNMMQNIHELTFYINSTGSGNNNYYKQFHFPLDKGGELNPKKVLGFISQCKNPFLSNINLIGNIFKYPAYQNFINNLSHYKVQITIYVTYDDFIENYQNLKNDECFKDIRFITLIDSIVKEPWISLHELDVKVLPQVIIRSEEEYTLFSEKSMNNHFYQDAKILPIYTGENFDFFKNNVFMDLGSLNESSLNKREILMHQILNTNYFGKLTIMPDNMVYADVNKEALGGINDNVYSLIKKELIQGTSWRRIRDVKPCNDCVCQWLCPSLSNYELAIGKPNLCHVKP